MRSFIAVLICMVATTAQAEHAPNIVIGIGYDFMGVTTRPGEEDQQSVIFLLPITHDQSEICAFPCELGPGYHDVVSQTMVLGGTKDFSVINNLGLPTETTDHYWVYHDLKQSHGRPRDNSWQQDDVSLPWRYDEDPYILEFVVGAPQIQTTRRFDLFFQEVSLIGTSHNLSNEYGRRVRLDFNENQYALTWHEGLSYEHTEYTEIPLPATLPGDLNFDRKVNFDDIAPFVLALSSPDEYLETWGRGRLSGTAAGDLSQDGDLDFDDIPLFVNALIGNSTAAIPEPSSLAMLIIGLGLFIATRRTLVLSVLALCLCTSSSQAHGKQIQLRFDTNTDNKRFTLEFEPCFKNCERGWEFEYEETPQIPGLSIDATLDQEARTWSWDRFAFNAEGVETRAKLRVYQANPDVLGEFYWADITVSYMVPDVAASAETVSITAPNNPGSHTFISNAFMFSLGRVQQGFPEQITIPISYEIAGPQERKVGDFELTLIRRGLGPPNGVYAWPDEDLHAQWGLGGGGQSGASYQPRLVDDPCSLDMGLRCFFEGEVDGVDIVLNISDLGWKLNNQSPEQALFRIIGDMDGNNHVDFDDIDDFVSGLNNPIAYETDFGVPVTFRGDMDGDGDFDFDDIKRFVSTLAGGASLSQRNSASHVPEPSAAMLALLGFGFVFLLRR